MIPFQRQVYEALKKKEAEQKREQINSAQGGQRPTKNSLAGSGGKTRSKTETIRYETSGENSEANTSFVD